MGPYVRVDRACVHCVLARAIAYVSRREGITFSVRSSLEPCIVPIRAGALYRSIRAILTADVDVLPTGPALIEVRLLGGTHPFIDVCVTTTVRNCTSARTLSIARHREGTLEGGFPECDTSGDMWMRRSPAGDATPLERSAVVR
jgi:hypothetical protein